MSTVDAHFGRKILEKTGIIYHNSIMKHIAGRGTVQAVFGHILYDRTAEGNIDDLHALADPDDRDSGGNRYVESLELQDVQFGVNSAGTFVFFTEKSRSDISAARQDQSVAGNDLSGNQSSHDLRGKCTEKGFIISCFGLASQND